MSVFPRVIVGLTLALSATVAGHANTDPAAPGEVRVVVLGDSISAGYGLSPDEAYPALLGELARRSGLDVGVVNAGVSGDTSAGGLSRVEWALSRKTDVLVIALGGNDGLRGLPPGEMEKNLQGIIDRAKAKWPDVRIVLAGMRMPGNMGADYAREFSTVFPRVAGANKALLVPFLLKGVGGDPRLNQPDRIHPTAEGQKIIAQTVWAVLEPVIREICLQAGSGTGGHDRHIRQESLLFCPAPGFLYARRKWLNCGG